MHDRYVVLVSVGPAQHACNFVPEVVSFSGNFDPSSVTVANRIKWTKITTKAHKPAREDKRNFQLRNRTIQISVHDNTIPVWGTFPNGRGYE